MIVVLDKVNIHINVPKFMIYFTPFQMSLRVKEWEIQGLRREVSSLKDDLLTSHRVRLHTVIIRIMDYGSLMLLWK